MSAYCTGTDLANGGLKTATVSELADVDGIIARASSRIDSYLRGRYKLPLVTVPDEIKDACVQIAVWYALQSLGWDPDQGADQSMQTGYEDTLKWLKLLSDGKVSLAISVDSTPTIFEGAAIVRSIPRNCGIRRDGRIP